MSRLLRNLLLLLSFNLIFSTNQALAENVKLFESAKEHPFYVGLQLGYGTTTWQYLVPDADKTSTLLRISVPETAKEGGFAWGFVAGYEFSNNIAFEIMYNRLPSARLEFYKGSYYAKKEPYVQNVRTMTDVFALYAKFMIHIDQVENLRPFALVGVSLTHRKDILAKTRYQGGAVFGAGLNHLISKHWMTELNFKYHTGFANSEMRVADNFIPFIYTINFMAAYRF